VFIVDHLPANRGKTFPGIHVPQAGRGIRENVTIGDLQQMDYIVSGRFDLVRGHGVCRLLFGLILSVAGVADI